MSLFRKAERRQGKLRLALCGPSGAGKTYSSLLIAKGIGGNIALVDTESGSGDLYAHLFDYQIATLAPPYTPQKYIDIIREAEANNIDVLIIDSLSHAWNAEGGVLDIAENTASKNELGKWKFAKSEQKKMLHKILSSKMHVICTMRSRTEYVMEENSKGKLSSKKVGLSPIQEKDIDYEFTSVFELSQGDNKAIASKDRTNIFGNLYFKPSTETGEKLLEWLNDGVSQEEVKRKYIEELVNSNKDNLKDVFTRVYNYSKSISDDEFMFQAMRIKEDKKIALGLVEPKKENLATKQELQSLADSLPEVIGLDEIEPAHDPELVYKHMINN
jgi:uncharacterized protein YacL (UPF0231 family)